MSEHSRSKYRHHAFLASKKRKRKPSTQKKFISPTKKQLKESMKGSWFNQENEVDQAAEKAKPSCSQRKILDFQEESESSDESEVDESDETLPIRDWIINIDSLNEHLQETACCKHCSSKLYLTENVTFRAGLGTKFTFKCLNPDCTSSLSTSNGFFTSERKKGVYDINRKSVLASRAIGKGCSGLEKFCSILGLIPITRNAFTEHTKFWENHALSLMTENLKDSASRAKKLLIQDYSLPTETNVVDLPTCFDGSWSTRGWVARKGIVAAIAENTSQVIDIIFKSNFCRYCEKLLEKRKNGDIDELEYLTLYTNHEPECFHNHEGSPQKMESDGVLQLYERSIDNYGIRYNPYIGDGDSSSYTNVDANRPYGPLYAIEKRDCVNHVTKRMGTNLRALLKEYKGKKLSDGKGLSGKGRLTISRVDAIQSFYGRAIRDHPNDPESMSRCTWAILNHYSSTWDNPKHDKCPKGENSWCAFQRDLAAGTSTYKPVKWPFTDAVIEAITPIFERLASVSFLEGSKHCHTQNPNESLNGLIWSLAPKEQYVSPLETSLAVSLGVCLFNSGMQWTYMNLFDKAGIEVTYPMLKKWATIDEYRVYKGNYSAREDRKQKRRMRKRAFVKKQSAFQHEEGAQYQSEAFYNEQSGSSGSKSKKKRGRKKKK